MSRPAAFFVVLAAAACASAQVTLSTVEGGVVAPIGQIYAFAPVALGSVANVDFRLTNTGSSQVYLTDLGVSGAYSPSPPYTQYFSVVCALSPDLCGGAQLPQLPILINPTGTLDFTVQFEPLQLGYPSATMNITAGNVIPTVFLTGTGVAPPPALTVLQNNQPLPAGQTISFGTNVPLGSSQTIALTLSNQTSALLPIPAISVTGSGFSISGSALSATSVLPGSSAELDVTFTAAAPGLEPGTLAIGSSTYPLRAGEPVLTVLQGNQALADGQTIIFSSIQLGLSETIALTLANQTNTLLAVPAIPPLTSGFSVSGSALSTTTVAPGSSIELNVIFTPAAVGLQNATLTIGESTYPLEGTGLAPTTLILLQGTQPVAAGQTISFGNVQVGSQQTIALTLANQTTVTLAVPAIPALSGDFSVSGTALSVTSLAPGLSVELDVTFIPSMTGSQSATLTVGTGTYPLQATGVPPSLTVLQGAQAVAAGQTINFGDVQTGTQQTIALTLANQSKITLAVPTIPPLTGAFSLSGSALSATSVVPGSSTELDVTFTPAATGPQTATLTVGAITYPIQGTGVPLPPLTLLEGAQRLGAGQTISFGNVQIGSQQTIALTLANQTTVTLAAPAIPPLTGAFSLSGSALSATSVAPGSSAELDVTFAPTATGPQTATLTIGANTYSLQGTGVPPPLTLLQGAQPVAAGQNISFGNVQVGWQQTITLTLANQSKMILAVPAIPAPAGDFYISGSALAATSVAPGLSVELDVTFAPTITGSRNSTLTIGSSTYPLQGTGLALTLLQGTQPVAPGQIISFGNVQVGSKQTIALTLTNTSTITLAVPVPAIPPPVGDFSLSGAAQSAASIAPGSSVELDVTFSPSITGAQTATLTVGTSTYSLQATGVTPPLTLLQGAEPVAAGQTINFGGVVVGSSQTIALTLANQSNITLAMPTIPLLTGAFHLSGSALSATSVSPGSSVALDVTFTPTATAPQTATLTIGANTYPLQATGVLAFPVPSIQMTPATLASAQQGNLTVSLASASPAAGNGTVTLAYAADVGGCPTATGNGNDPAIAFANGTLSATFTVAQGATVGQFANGPSVSFGTGTTAGALCFNVTLGSNSAPENVPIPPALVGVDTAVAERDVACDPALVYCTTTNIQLQINGWDNTRSTSQLVFSFFNSSGSEIAPGNIAATELYFQGVELGTAAAFQQYFTASAMGGVFGLTVFFPVTGDADQVTTAAVQLTNSAGTSTTSKITF